jgi:hypothetical protein
MTPRDEYLRRRVEPRLARVPYPVLFLLAIGIFFILPALADWFGDLLTHLVHPTK